MASIGCAAPEEGPGRTWRPGRSALPADRLASTPATAPAAGRSSGARRSSCSIRFATRLRLSHPDSACGSARSRRRSSMPLGRPAPDHDACRPPTRAADHGPGSGPLGPSVLRRACGWPNGLVCSPAGQSGGRQRFRCGGPRDHGDGADAGVRDGGPNRNHGSSVCDSSERLATGIAAHGRGRRRHDHRVRGVPRGRTRLPRSQGRHRCAGRAREPIDRPARPLRRL